MQVFWERGYCATNMAALVEATHLKPGSLYAAFQSKEGLFLAALDYYSERGAAHIETLLTNADSPLTGIRAYFRELAENASVAGRAHSCLLVNSALELGNRNAAVHARVTHHLERIEAMFRRALQTAQANGELSPEQQPRALATFLMSSIWGLRVLGASAPSPQRAHAVVDQILTLLDH